MLFSATSTYRCDIRHLFSSPVTSSPWRSSMIRVTTASSTIPFVLSPAMLLSPATPPPLLLVLLLPLVLPPPLPPLLILLLSLPLPLLLLPLVVFTASYLPVYRYIFPLRPRSSIRVKNLKISPHSSVPSPINSHSSIVAATPQLAQINRAFHSSPVPTLPSTEVKKIILPVRVRIHVLVETGGSCTDFTTGTLQSQHEKTSRGVKLVHLWQVCAG